MTVLAEAPVRKAQDSGGLRQFLAADCAALIWERKTPRDVQTWLDGLSPDQLPEGRIILQRNAVAETVRQLCSMACMPIGLERTWLEDDITEWAQQFSDLIQTR